nr:hypothetical protein [Tanacetum cinerariifolium]
KSETPEPEAPTFAITTRSGVSTQDPPFLAPSLKKQKKDDEDEQLLSIFKRIHINLSFLEVIIHMLKGAKVLKDLLSHKEKLEKQPPRSNLLRNVLLSSKEVCPKKKETREASPCHVDTVSHDGKLAKEEEEEDSNKVHAVSFYHGTEPIEPLEWKAQENKLKPSSVEPPKLELKELLEHLEYALLLENNQLPVVISSALSTVKKSKLLEGLAALLAILVTGVSQSRQHGKSESDSYYLSD